MATTPTTNPVPSESPRDLKFNAGKIDDFVTSIVNSYIDRLGNEHYTINGLENLVRQIIGTLGWVPFGTFEDGATLTNATQTLKYEADGNYYRWNGDFNKIIPAGSTPENSGGVGIGAWVNVTDLTLRSALSQLTGASMIGISQGGTVQNAITYITPEMFGAIGDGVTDDYTALQAALTYWRNNPNCDFMAAGNYLLSRGVIVVSPRKGSRCFINTLIQSSTWTDSGVDLFNRIGSLVTLSTGGVGNSMWGASFHVGEMVGTGSGPDGINYHIHGIRNLGWQQCEISYGHATGLISTVEIVNSENTTPTVQYKARIARGNLFNFLARSNLSNMFEGCSFETMWGSGGGMGAEVLGAGSAYTHIHNGSVDFSGGLLSFLALNTIPANVPIGQPVTLGGNLVGWTIGVYYRESDSTRYAIIAERKFIDDATGSAAASAFSVGSNPAFGGVTYTVTGKFGPNNSHTPGRFLPSAICIAPTTQTIVRWRIDRNYDAGVIFPSDVYRADSFVDTANEVSARTTPLPSACKFSASVPQGVLSLAGARFATRLVLSNLEIKSPGGFNTATAASVWRHNGGGVTVLVSDGVSTSTVAFTSAGLGRNQITGRISGRGTDPATDSIGLWEITGFGENTDGSLCIDKWTVLTSGGAFKIIKSVSGTASTLTSTVDGSGLYQLTLNASINATQAASGASWQYRMTAMRTFML
ncbi:hypothetical protein [Pectobacterium sp. B2J-2]|uniref:tail fiber/spike domain-containing protein n=1 Tax=Pectobacterium sp. B2J-2 TaxID=3385372 RepID=UPI0038FCF7EE